MVTQIMLKCQNFGVEFPDVSSLKLSFEWRFSNGFFPNMWQELRTKQQLGYIVQLSLGHGYCLNILNSAQQNIELRQRQEAYGSLKGSNRSIHTLAPKVFFLASKIHRFVVYASHEQSNMGTISSCLKSGFLLNLGELRTNSEGKRFQTLRLLAQLPAAEWKISSNWWVSKKHVF